MAAFMPSSPAVLPAETSQQSYECCACSATSSRQKSGKTLRKSTFLHTRASFFHHSQKLSAECVRPIVENETWRVLEITAEQRDISKEELFAYLAKEPDEDFEDPTLACRTCSNQGVVACPQCQGGGVNLEDKFGGRYKAGEVCWLCMGRSQVACPDCTASLGDS